MFFTSDHLIENPSILTRSLKTNVKNLSDENIQKLNEILEKIGAKSIKKPSRGLLGEVLEAPGANLVHKAKMKSKTMVRWTPWGPQLGGQVGSMLASKPMSKPFEN